MAESMVKWTSGILFAPLMLFMYYFGETGVSLEIVSNLFLIVQVSNAHCRKLGREIPSGVKEKMRLI